MSALLPSAHVFQPAPPFDFAQSLRFLGGFTPTQGEQRMEAQTLTKAVRVRGHTVAFTLRSAGTTDAPQLTCELDSGAPLPADVEAAALDRVQFFLSLGEDLTPFYALAEDDQPFSQVARSLYGYHQVKFLTPFENAVWAVLTQRTPGGVAKQVKRRFVEAYGQQIETPGGPLWAFPEAADLTGVTVSELSATLGNARKAEYVASVVQAFSGVEEAWLRAAPEPEVSEWLRNIRGFGAWSATFVLIRGLGRMERAVPSDPDSVFVQELQRAASKVYGPLEFGELQARAQHYGAWQGYWAHYLRAVS